eukprot:COSAG02_NODE_1098_length_14587_cov_9.462590_8_plen_55_part_00
MALGPHQSTVNHFDTDVFRATFQNLGRAPRVLGVVVPHILALRVVKQLQNTRGH